MNINTHERGYQGLLRVIESPTVFNKGIYNIYVYILPLPTYIYIYIERERENRPNNPDNILMITLIVSSNMCSKNIPNLAEITVTRCL